MTCNIIELWTNKLIGNLTFSFFFFSLQMSTHKQLSYKWLPVNKPKQGFWKLPLLCAIRIICRAQKRYVQLPAWDHYHPIVLWLIKLYPVRKLFEVKTKISGIISLFYSSYIRCFFFFSFHFFSSFIYFYFPFSFLFTDDLVRKLTSFLLNCNQDAERMEKLASYGILGFAINSTDFYEFSDVKSAIKRGPYY